MARRDPVLVIDPIAVIEVANHTADIIDSFKRAFVERGWDEHAAQVAALSAYQIERMAGGKR